MLTANSAAILTDAFPPDRRGFALGFNQVAALAGQFIGLVAGGLLAAWDWRAVFWVNVPVGVFGTLWAYRRCATTVSDTAAASTGGATSPSLSGCPRSSSPSPPAYNRTAATPPDGTARSCSGR